MPEYAFYDPPNRTALAIQRPEEADHIATRLIQWRQLARAAQTPVILTLIAEDEARLAAWRALYPDPEDAHE